MAILLRAICYNWSLSTFYDYKYIIYELSQDGMLHVDVEYTIPAVSCDVKVGDEDMKSIRHIISTTDQDGFCSGRAAMDGEGWRFKCYDEKRSIVIDSGLGNYAGVEPLERIHAILMKLTPPHKTPDQLKMIDIKHPDFLECNMNLIIAYARREEEKMIIMESWE